MGRETQMSHRAQDVKKGVVFLGTRGLDSTSASSFTRPDTMEEGSGINTAGNPQC